MSRTGKAKRRVTALFVNTRGNSKTPSADFTAWARYLRGELKTFPSFRQKSIKLLYHCQIIILKSYTNTDLSWDVTHINGSMEELSYDSKIITSWGNPTFTGEKRTSKWVTRDIPLIPFRMPHQQKAHIMNTIRRCTYLMISLLWRSKCYCLINSFYVVNVHFIWTDDLITVIYQPLAWDKAHSIIIAVIARPKYCQY